MTERPAELDSRVGEQLKSVFTKKGDVTVLDTRHCKQGGCDFVVHKPGNKDILVFTTTKKLSPDFQKQCNNFASFLDCDGICVHQNNSKSGFDIQVTKTGSVVVYIPEDCAVPNAVKAIHQINDLLRKNTE